MVEGKEVEEANVEVVVMEGGSKAAEAVMEAVEEIHNIFWAAKGRDVPWYTAS